MSIIIVVDVHKTLYPLLPAGLYCCLESVRVVEVLQCFGCQVDTQLFQLTRLAVLETKHVEDSYKAIDFGLGLGWNWLLMMD